MQYSSKKKSSSMKKKKKIGKKANAFMNMMMGRTGNPKA